MRRKTGSNHWKGRSSTFHQNSPTSCPSEWYSQLQSAHLDQSHQFQSAENVRVCLWAEGGQRYGISPQLSSRGGAASV